MAVRRELGRRPLCINKKVPPPFFHLTPGTFGEDCVYGIRAGAAGLVSELDAAEVTLGPLLSCLGQ